MYRVKQGCIAHRAILWILNFRLLTVEILQIYWKIDIKLTVPCGDLYDMYLCLLYSVING